jgi:hypothetical protein
MRTVERSRDRRELVRAAGMAPLSLVSVVAGVVVAYGTLLVLLAVAAGIGSALGLETSGISDDEWRDLGVGAAATLAVVLFASSFFGGYVAGRMSRRGGPTHGVLVFVLAVGVLAAIAGVASVTTDGDAVTRELDDQGIPTAADDWRDIGLAGGAGMLAALLIGSVLGGIKGERWHGVLATRASDPGVPPRGHTGNERVPRRGDPDDTLDLPAVVPGDPTMVTSTPHDTTAVQHDSDETRVTRLQ